MCDVESAVCECSCAHLMEVQTAVCWLMLRLAMSETLIYMHLEQRYLKCLCLIIQIKLPMLPLPVDVHSGRAQTNKQGNEARVALTFNWFLIESDRRLTFNEIHTGHLEQPMCEGQTSRGESCSHLLTQTVRCSPFKKLVFSYELRIWFPDPFETWCIHIPL